MEPGQTQGACLHTPATREFPHGRLRHRADYDVEQIKKMQREARIKSSWLSEKVGYPDKDTRFVSFVFKFFKFSLVWRGVVAVWLIVRVDRIQKRIELGREGFGRLKFY